MSEVTPCPKTPQVLSEVTPRNTADAKNIFRFTSAASNVRWCQLVIANLIHFACSKTSYNPHFYSSYTYLGPEEVLEVYKIWGLFKTSLKIIC